MKRIIALAFASFLAIGAAVAQQPAKQHGQHGGQHCGNCPHHQQQARQPRVDANGIDMTIVDAFPTVSSVKADGKFTAVYDAKQILLGYIVYSKPASNGIKGYAGETPVMIAFTPKKKICGVFLLPNQETPRFVQHVRQAGFFTRWNGLSIKKARKKNVDTVTGATFTSKAVIKSVQAVLSTL